MLNQSAGLPPLFLLLVVPYLTTLNYVTACKDEIIQGVCVKVIIRPEIFEKLENSIEDFPVSIKLVHSEKKYYYENKLFSNFSCMFLNPNGFFHFES